MGAPSTQEGLKIPLSESNSNRNRGNDDEGIGCGDNRDAYISLIQQYLSMFQIDNAIWLAERCVAEYPKCLDVIYLRALCYYRCGKPKTARHIIERSTTTTMTTSTTSTTPDDGNNSSNNTKIIASMHYLSAQCSYELGEYSRGETSLLKETRRAYKLVGTGCNMDEWILQTTPCPVPNGASGLGLLGKLCRKSNRNNCAIKYFRMSLQLDPFLFTSFQSLCELGVNDLDVNEVFGGNTDIQTRSSQESLKSKPTQPLSLRQSNQLPALKTPLQPLDISSSIASPGVTVIRHNLRSLVFDTPGLTPIAAVNESITNTPTQQHGRNAPGGHGRVNSRVVRRARQVAKRQYYPPSPDSTPVMSSVTRSMRYLNGLGTVDSSAVLNLDSIDHSQTLPSTTETQTLGTSRRFPNLNQRTNSGTTVDNNGIRVGDIYQTRLSDTTVADGDDENTVSNSGVQSILDLLSIAGCIYQYVCQYQCKEALQLMQLLPTSQQCTPWALHQQGRAFLELGDFQSSQRCLEYMHKIEPSRMQGLELLSTVYWQLKKEMELANLAQTALDWDLLSPESHCVVGNCFSLQKDHETALVFFKRSLQLDPDFTYTHTLSGYEYMSNEDFDSAIACFRQALRTDERHYNAWYGLGAIYHRQEKFDLAEYHFEKAVSIHPTSCVLRCNLGMSQFANGKAFQALETLSEAYRLDFRNPQTRFQRATIYSALHRPEEALAELKAVRDAAPREATVHFAMAKVLKRLGRIDEAMKCFLTAMDLDPKDNQLIKSAMDKLDEPDVDEESMAAY